MTVKKDLKPVDSHFPFEKGKAYVFHLKLSLDPIDFSISTKVEDFVEGKNE